MPPGAVFMIVGFGQVALAALGYAGVLVATWIPRLYPYRQRLVGGIVGSVPGAMVGLTAGYAMGVAAGFLASLRNSDSAVPVVAAVIATGYLVGLATGVVRGWRGAVSRARSGGAA